MQEIPVPLVRFQQGVLVTTLVTAFLVRQPLLTTALLALLIPGLVLGPQANLLFRLGRRLLARRLPGAPTEATSLQRFNLSLAVAMLAAAQVAFAAGAFALGWALSLAVAGAAALALAGFCVGCFLYYQLRLLRYRLRRAG